MTKMNKRTPKDIKTKTLVSEPIIKNVKKSIKNPIKKVKDTKINKPQEKAKKTQETQETQKTQETMYTNNTQQYSIQPPPAGLAYVPAYMFNIIVNSFEREIDKFRNSFDNFIKINNIIYNNNALDWLETDKFIHDYIKQLTLDGKLDKFITEYEMIDGMILLIEYYKNYLYKDVYENEMEIIYYIKNNVNETKYDMVYCIIKKIVGHESYETIMGF